MKVGIIGTGNMGKVLIDAFISSQAVSSSDIFITNRTIQKALRIKKQYSDIHVCYSADILIQEADLIFLCIKPLQIHPFLQKYKQNFSTDKCFVSITSPISVQQIESVLPCQVARVIPSITNQALGGVSLVTFGDSCSKQWSKELLTLLGHISFPFVINNELTRISSDITSCGPAFFSYLLQQFIHAATEKTVITEEQATKLAEEMIIGMGNLLEKQIFSLSTLQEKVSVKGGITGVGVDVLEEKTKGAFEGLIEATHEKFSKEIIKIEEQFGVKY